MAPCHRAFLFFSLMVTASLTISSSLSPNLCVFIGYQALQHPTMEIIWSLFFWIWWTYQLDAGSCWTAWAMAYLATWIGYDSLRLGNFSHDVDPSFHLQQMSQPAFDFLRVSHLSMSIFWSSTVRAEPLFLWLMNDSNNRYSFLSTSHWACIEYVLMFAASSVISSPGNTTS